MDRSMVVPEERRRRPRIALHWPVRLFREPETQSVETTTENLTSNGFYCISHEPFKLGERLDCIIAVPSGNLGFPNSPVSLQCRIRVTRVEEQRDGFGLGCYIEDYDLLVKANQARQTAAKGQ